MPTECLIEVRPHKNGWEAFEAKGVQPYFLEKRHAVSYTIQRMSSRSGEVRIYESDGKTIEKIIKINEAERPI